jgi:KaiC/GvpD/RAD55 family RecA-like ATPase
VSKVRTLAEAFTDYELWATDPTPRIGFGMPWFDQPTNGGIGRSEIAMFMAFSSVGKTTVALNIIRNNPGIPVLFFSLEMNWRMVAARLAAIDRGITTRDIEASYRKGEPPDYIDKIVDRFRNFVCDDTPAITLKEASESFHRAADRLGTAPRLVVWDYLELIGGGGLLGKSEQVDKASQKLRDWTREHDCTTLVLHQVGKGDGGSDPLDLSSGRYGGYAPMDYVCGAYAPRLRNGISSIELAGCREEIWFQLLKNRSGQANPVGDRYRLDPATMRIQQWNLPVYKTGVQTSWEPF